jgi:hypothetical protein
MKTLICKLFVLDHIRTIALCAWAFSFLAFTLAASAQSGTQPTKQLIDCTGTMAAGYDSSTNTMVFTSIGDYLSKVGPIGTAFVQGECRENVQIWNGDQFQLIGPAAINGNVSIGTSPDAVFFQNLTITNPGGDGIDVSGSKLSLNSCIVSNNAGNGVSIDNASHVVVVGTGTYNNNSGWAGAFHLSGHSFLNISPSGPVAIQGNANSGIWATQSDIQTSGNTLVNNNTGTGIFLQGGSRAQIGNGIGSPNQVENNKGGGISVLENSELSLWVCCSNSSNLVIGNGKFGIADGFHSQVTLSGAEVSQNAGPGVDVYAGSQVDFYPGSQNRVVSNGTSLNAAPGVRINGNSQAWLHGSEISNNMGSLGPGNQSPGIQLLVNSSVEIGERLNFGNNAGGTTGPINSNGITCDFTSIAVSDVVLNVTTGCIGGGRFH